MSRHHITFAFLDEPPFCFRDPGANAAGCDVEVARHVSALACCAGFDAVETEFAQLMPGLADGRWHMTTGMFVTDERRRMVAFSRPIWALHDGLLVRAGDRAGIEGYRSLARDPSLTLAVVADQVQHQTALRLGVAAGRVRVFATQEQAACAVAEGAADAYASVAMAHRGYLAKLANHRLAVVDVPASEQAPAFGAFAFARDDDRLRAAIDDALSSYLNSPAHRGLMAGYGFSPLELSRLP